MVVPHRVELVLESDPSVIDLDGGEHSESCEVQVQCYPSF